MDLDLPADPQKAIDSIISRFQIPWKGRLEKSTRIFINREFADAFIHSGKQLRPGDQISLIPISGGG
jgi:hypothetical protein